MKASAEVVADSISPDGVRLTTLEVVMHPRAVEHFLTHRAFSRNGASKRAIPLSKQIRMVAEDPCYPAKFGSEQKGMQSGPELRGADLQDAKMEWIKARNAALDAAHALGALGIHKEVAHAPLAPFQPRKYVVTATEWEGFFAQRIHDDAQAEIRQVAEAIRDAMAGSDPEKLSYGEWHTPYVDEEERHYCERLGLRPEHVSAGRCAAVSYLNHAAKQPLAAGVERFHRLASAAPPHASPMEHTARPFDSVADDREYWTGNFRGWVQLRHTMGLR